jgi:hypothetical protein
MKKAILGMGVAVLAVAGWVGAAEPYFLVKVQGLDRTLEMKVMSAAEVKALEKTLVMEKRLFPQAIAAAQKEWKADELNKTVTFPAAKVIPRTIVGMPEKYLSQEKADEALARYEDRLARRRMKEEETLKGQSKKTKSDKDEQKELVALQAVELVRAKLDELLTKAGMAPVGEAPAELLEKAPKADDEQGNKKKADAKKAAEKAL